ncbi:MAG: 4-hydroxy-tetrahydrodipicolinate reductase [Chloroflexi bacterium]|nr:4-hydroxy-tetrahydrodipicolinate reductase [Chloroflexota bacterium]
MVKVVIVGAAGRMGRMLIAGALQDKDLELAGGVVEPGFPEVGADLGNLGGQQPIGVFAVDNLDAAIGNADVVIEFTAPEASVQHVELAARHKKAAVIGTTGLDAAQMERIRAAARSVPVLVAPNMSVGVNVLERILPLIARTLGEGYDIEIVEAHHRMKKDAPSGTALKLAQVIAEALGKDLDDVGVYGRHGIAPRTEGEIGVHAVRAGGIVGDHRVIFANDGEEIEIVHRAFSRQTFVLGALRAAKYIVNQKPGLYSIQDVLEVA